MHRVVGFNKWLEIVFLQRLEHVCLIYLRFERLEPIEYSSICERQACQSCLPEAGTGNRFWTVRKCCRTCRFPPTLDCDNYSWTKGSAHIIMFRRELWHPFHVSLDTPKALFDYWKGMPRLRATLVIRFITLRAFQTKATPWRNFNPIPFILMSFIFNYSSARNFPADSDSNDCLARIL